MESKFSTSFGQWLKRQRKAFDLTQGELAKRVGCAIITIQKIEANERRPSKQLARLLSRHLGIPGEKCQEFVRFARGEISVRRYAAFHEIGRQSSRALSSSQFTNIPTPPTPLIGRDQETATAKKRLLDEDARLLTLVGPPGVGKTRLAIQIASCLLDEFNEGAYFVFLASINDANLVAATIAQTLGVNQIGEMSFADRLKEYLRDKHLLLVLDNFEHVIAAARFVAELLSTCPWLSILVTSRAPLSIRGERQFPVSSLAVPDEEKTEFDPSTLICYSAIEFFVERAQAIKPEFKLKPENANAVAEICKRLDGLPLAIELVAARVSLLPPQALLEQFGRQQMLHSDGLRDGPERHHTLHHAIDWSYSLLSSEARLMLTRISVFNGGWTHEAVEKIMSDQSVSNTQEVLNSLVGNNLVVLYEHLGEPRFTLLETIRAFALERLAETGEKAYVQQRHAEYYLALADEADPHLRTSAQLVWLNRLEAERGNLRSALAWFIDYSHDTESGLRLAGTLAWFWTIRCHLSEGREWLTKALRINTNASSILRARVLFGLGTISWLQGDVSTARTLMDECVALYRDLGQLQRFNLAWALTGLAMISAYQADYDTTQATAEEVVELTRKIGDEWMVALALCVEGEACMMRQDYAGASSCFDEGSRIFRNIGDKYGLGATLLDWGYLDSIQNNFEKARDRLEDGIAMFGQIGERWMRAITLNILGQVVQQQGDYNQATVYYSESLNLLRKMGLENNIADVLFNLAQLTQSQGHFVLAKRLYEECMALFLKQGNEKKTAECRAGLAVVSDNQPEVKRE